MKQSSTFFSFLFIFFLSQAKAQITNGKISGLLIDEKEKPLSGTIVLKNLADTMFVKSISTNDKGQFSFQNLPYGKFSLSINAVGSKTINEKIEITPNKLFIDKTFKLIAESNDLGSINISGKKPLIERFSDKTVMNVENSLVATGNTALEVLAKMPGVSVNQDGIISVKGKSGVNILIDGKSVFLSSEQLATRLKSINSNELKSIELITNPSAKYDAEGNAGIINVKLKKNSVFGANGNVDLGFGYGKNPKSDAGISLNHRNKNLNIFGNFASNNNKYQEDLNINRITNDGFSDTYFHQYNTQIRSSHNNNYKLGLDYFLNEKNTIGFLTTGYFNNGHDSSNGITDIGKSFTKIDSSIVADNPSTNKYRNQAYNLNYKSVIDTLGQEFSVDLDYAKYRSEEYTVYNNYFSDANGYQYKSPLTFRNLTPSVIKIKAVKIDYSLPLNPKTKFDFGLKSSWVSTDNDFRFENLVASQWRNDVTRSNRFVYDENINAAYVNFKHDFKSTSVEVGLRTEQTNSKGNSVSEQKVVERSYFDFFPSFSVNQTLSENNQLGFSYSRRIDRPDYKSLNPFVYFVDLYTFSQGNPFLNPQYTNAFTFSYNYKDALNISLGYSITNNLIIDVLLPDDVKKTLFQTVQNLDKQFSYDLTVGYPTNITKYWSMDNTITSTYNQIKSANLGGVDYDRKKVNFTLNSSHNFAISPSTTAELSGEFVSAQIYGTYAIKPYYGIDFGLKKSFIDKRLNLKFAINDILNSRKARIGSALSTLNYSLSQKQESQIFRVSLNYSFGSNTVKATRDRKTSVTDEEGRIKQENK
ncbi:TonB-dependent receptor domain-containing protein [Pedobacter rhodius]|uniref:Outer membrane beta-barrel protein n=1 Tax=Pedobacter rhodius TaxID=3004098 RepID=A0ABT4L052_9SPHI|nr:TonB-dependent receptor [Pedobacter sp. SJ11]MCZ4224554.1 outer membrane beta-barrel protein [Pedobacter sp. SJ11]